MRLKAPDDTTQFVTSGGTAYEVDETGHVEVPNEAHAAEMLHHAHGFKPAPKPFKDVEATDAAADPFAGMNKSDLIDWLEERGIEVPSRPSRAQLLDLAREHADAAPQGGSEGEGGGED